MYLLLFYNIKNMLHFSSRYIEFNAECDGSVFRGDASICIARISYGNVSGWLGGCPSHAGIVSKWLNLSENFFHHLEIKHNSVSLR